MYRRSFLFSTAAFPIYFGTSLGLAFLSKDDSQLTMHLTPQEKSLARMVGFDETVLLMLKTESQGEINQLKDYKFDTYPARLIGLEGISVLVPKERLWDCFNVIQKKLPVGYLATVFNNDNYIDRDHPLPDLVAVIKSHDRYDFLRLRNTNGTNYGWQTKDVIAKLKTWESQFEFDITLVGYDLVSLEFKRLPTSLCSFAEEVYSFCPDSVDQGVSLNYDRRKDEDVFRTAKHLCTGVKFNSKYDAEMIRGIELLAYEMRKTKQLVLWWD